MFLDKLKKQIIGIVQFKPQILPALIPLISAVAPSVISAIGGGISGASAKKTAAEQEAERRREWEKEMQLKTQQAGDDYYWNGLKNLGNNAMTGQQQAKYLSFKNGFLK